MAVRSLPLWAEDIRATYLRGEASVFLLHGNVFDMIPHEGQLVPIVDFLTGVLLRKKKVVCHFNPSSGIRVLRREQSLGNLEELMTAADTSSRLGALEKTLRTADEVAVVVDYAETIVPAGDLSLLGESDRHAIVSVHRWSLDRRFENSDNVVILVAENPSEVAPKVVSNPRIHAVAVPLPDKDERAALIRLLESDASSRDTERLAGRSAGLRNVQIRGIWLPARTPRKTSRRGTSSSAKSLGMDRKTPSAHPS